MAARPKILLLGAGGHARACIDVIEQHGEYAILGLIGAEGEVGRTVLGYPVLGSDNQLPVLLEQADFGIVVVGQIKTPEPRMRLFSMLEACSRLAPVIISPRAYVSPHAHIGPGSLVLHGAIVNAGAVIGKNCIINSLSLVEHDVRVGDHCHVATGARLNGGADVGEGCMLGSGCTIREGVRIGQRSLIGMGQAVRRNVSDGEVFY